MKKHVPNFFTLLNLLAGCISLAFLFQGTHYKMAALMGIFSLIFDYLDGFLARIFKVKSELGKQLDSLADLISFGIVPSSIAFLLLKESLEYQNFLPKSFAFVAFLIALASAWRLARFNLENSSYSHFRGLPTPANSFFFTSLSLWKVFDCKFAYLLNSYLILFVIILLTSYLLISSIKMISFKFSSISWKENKSRYLFLFFIIISFTLFPFFCNLVYLPILYVISSVVFEKINYL